MNFITTLAFFVVAGLFGYMLANAISLGEQVKEDREVVEDLKKRFPAIASAMCPPEIDGRVFVHSIYKTEIRGIDTGLLTCYYRKPIKAPAGAPATSGSSKSGR